MRCWCSRRRASSRSTPSRTVIRFSLVISSDTCWPESVAKRTSRLVRMPTSLPRLVHHRDAGDAVLRLSSSTSASVASGTMVIGLTTMPALELLHLAHLVGLTLGIEVAVDDPDAAGLGHGDGEARLGHRVHRRGNERDAELDAAGQPGAGVDLGRQDRGCRRLEQDIVEGQILGKGERVRRHRRHVQPRSVGASGWRLSLTPARSRAKCSMSPESARQHEQLGRIAAARLGLDMPNHGEIPLHAVEKLPFGAAAQHLAQEGAARFEDLLAKSRAASHSAMILR